MTDSNLPTPEEQEMTDTRCEICKRYPYGFGRVACECNRPSSRDTEEMTADKLIDALIEACWDYPKDWHRDGIVRDAKQALVSQIEKRGKDAIAALSLENQRLRDTALEILSVIASSPKHSIGAVDNTHVAQIGVETVHRWRSALHPK